MINKPIELKGKLSKKFDPFLEMLKNQAIQRQDWSLYNILVLAEEKDAVTTITVRNTTLNLLYCN